jgi:uncharacterized NAD(P)/FAD-binding protein YdhS
VPALNSSSATTVAIIGGGAACISFLFHFMEFRPRYAVDTQKILIFEKERPVGPGLAYQEDHADLILNRVAEAMSISPRKPTLFSKWMLWKANYSREIRGATGGSFPDVYVPRRIFGRFLRDSFRAIQDTASEYGILIDVIHEAIVRIDRIPELHVHSQTRSWAAGHVVLATGHTNPKDHYGLSGHNRYIHSVYPVSNHLEKLRSASSICILGASLTAIDVAVGLQSAGYRGRIDMLSKRGLLPYVKGNSYPSHVLQHLTESALKRITDHGISNVSLRSVLRLFRRELRSVGVNWKTLFANECPDAKGHLDAQIESAGEIRPWAPIFRAMNDLVHDLWNSLDKESQHIFLRRFSRRWMSIRTPIPVQNAKRLQAMTRTGQLCVSSGPATFSVAPCGRLEMTRKDGSKELYDAVVNATGTAASIDGPSGSELIWSLLQSGIAVTDTRGGIKVDFASGALISGTGMIDKNVRALGHVTSGTYFYVDSLDMVSRQAQRIAMDLMKDICGHNPRIVSQSALEISFPVSCNIPCPR